MLHVRVPASCVLYVPEAQGSSPPLPPPLSGQFVRAAARVPASGVPHVLLAASCTTGLQGPHQDVRQGLDRAGGLAGEWLPPQPWPQPLPQPHRPSPSPRSAPHARPSEPAHPASRRATSGTTRNPNPNPNPNPYPNPKREQACDVWYHETISVNVMGIGGAIEAAVEKTRCEP